MQIGGAALMIVDQSPITFFSFECQLSFGIVGNNILFPSPPCIEVENQSLSQATREATWLRHLMVDFGYPHGYLIAKHQGVIVLI